jgi:hypothetical protein
MTTVIGNGGPSTGVSGLPSAARVTAPTGQPFSALIGASAGAILSGAEQAVTRLPGGPILAAALRPTASNVGSAVVSAPAAVGTGAGLGSVTPEGSAGTAGNPGGAPAGAESAGVEAALNQSATQNMFFLDLQERMSAESRSYSAMSNVLKTRHDTVKNAIGNIR